jgi:cytochrome P450
MAFAPGPHNCVGQHLARLEMSRALNILLDRLPKLRLDPEHPPPAVRGSSFRPARLFKATLQIDKNFFLDREHERLYRI